MKIHHPDTFFFFEFFLWYSQDRFFSKDSKRQIFDASDIIVSVRRMVMDRDRLYKIVLLTLVAPRGVNDLHLS